MLEGATLFAEKVTFNIMFKLLFKISITNRSSANLGPFHKIPFTILYHKKTCKSISERYVVKIPSAHEYRGSPHLRLYKERTCKNTLIYGECIFSLRVYQFLENPQVSFEVETHKLKATSKGLFLLMFSILLWCSNNFKDTKLGKASINLLIQPY